MTLLFIFDMDDVLYAYDWRARMAEMARLTGRSFEQLRALWWTAENGESAAEAGVYRTAEEYLLAFESAVGSRVAEDDWVRARALAMTAWEGSLAAVRRASEFGRVTLLTNNGALVAKHLPTIAPELVPIFGEHLHASSDYGARKPDPTVFERVLERYRVAASNAFFADDLVENVASAASLGISAHLFTSPDGLLEAVEAFVAQRTP